MIFDNSLEPPTEWAEMHEKYSEWKMNYVYSENPYKWIKIREAYAIKWLARELDIGTANLLDLIEAMRSDHIIGESFYRQWDQKKRNGGVRRIYAPNEELKRVQKAINQHILKKIYSAGIPAFGFSGGGIIDALKPHLYSRSILRVDFRDAFDSVTRDDVFEMFHREFHWYVSEVLTDLTTFFGRLRQGPPTSSRIFDLACYGLDFHLSRMADNVWGKYTRYADNIFFSFPGETFPRPTRQAILKLIENQRSHLNSAKKRKGPNFRWHKLRIGSMRNTIHALGLNIIDGRLHNTRVWKSEFRKTLHHVWFLLNNNMDAEPARMQLEGMMQFAIEQTLPQKLIDEYNKIYIVYTPRRPGAFNSSIFI